MLFMMVCFTVYTVIMRYVFENPPVWGDLLTVLSNIWFVFIALALTVREKEHIALNLIYTRLPTRVGFAIQQLWSAVICALGFVICVYGWEVVSTMSGKYWEMWYFAWEDGGFVFKPNYMPKKYAMMILPVAGILISLGALVRRHRGRGAIQTRNVRGLGQHRPGGRIGSRRQPPHHSNDRRGM